MSSDNARTVRVQPNCIVASVLLTLCFLIVLDFLWFCIRVLFLICHAAVHPATDRPTVIALASSGLTAPAAARVGRPMLIEDGGSWVGCDNADCVVSARLCQLSLAVSFKQARVFWPRETRRKLEDSFANALNWIQCVSNTSGTF